MIRLQYIWYGILLPTHISPPWQGFDMSLHSSLHNLILLLPTITVLQTPLEQSRLFSQDDIHLLESQYEPDSQSSLVLQLSSEDKHTYMYKYCSLKQIQYSQ